MKDYKELMELASKGDETRVSTVGRDLRNNNNGGKEFYDFYPEDIVVFPLGKILDKKSEGIKTIRLAHFPFSDFPYTIEVVFVGFTHVKKLS